MTELVHRVIDTTETVEALARKILQAGRESHVAIDTETTGLSPYTGDYLTGISICIATSGTTEPSKPLEGFYVPVAHPSGNSDLASVRVLLLALNETKATHLFHHCTFDWAFLLNTHLGFELGHRTVDTMVVRWMQDENAPKALKVLGEMYLGEDATSYQRALKLIMEGPFANQTDAYRWVRSEYPDMPVVEAREEARHLRTKRTWGSLLPHEIGLYAARDATLTAQIGEVLLDGRGTTGTIAQPGEDIEREMAVQDTITRVTRHGVSADITQLEAARDLYTARAAELAYEMDDEFGALWRKRTGKDEPLNLASSQHAAWLLYGVAGLPVLGRTPGDQPSTSKIVLEQLQGNPLAKAVLDYRGLIKAAGSYAEPLIEYAKTSYDGRIHGMYESTRTVTGRLSASNPNVMTIPRGDTLPEIRNAFAVADPGMERVGFDLASAELWVTASITQDPVLTRVLTEGSNLHVETMKAVFNTDDKASRFYTLSKNINFGALYEAGVATLATFAAKAGYGPDEALAVARHARDVHRKLYATQHEVADKLAKIAREKGQVKIAPGRYRHFNSPGKQVEYYTALNAMVQGGVAELVKDVMLEVFKAGYGDLLVLQVHDELVFDAPIGMREELHTMLTTATAQVNRFDFPMLWAPKVWSRE